MEDSIRKFGGNLAIVNYLQLIKVDFSAKLKLLPELAP